VYGVRSRYGPCPGFSVEVCKPNDLPPPITTHTKACRSRLDPLACCHETGSCEQLALLTTLLSPLVHYPAHTEASSPALVQPIQAAHLNARHTDGVDNVLHSAATTEVVHWLAQALHHRPHGNGSSCEADPRSWSRPPALCEGGGSAVRIA